MLRVLAVVSILVCAPSARALENAAPTLWQERFFWDALLTARDRLARQQSDPMMIPVMNAIAGQVAQQVANLAQIDQYVKAQGENLRFAYAQTDTQPSLETILNNFDTLKTGSDQVRQNLYYLTTRERMAQSQALPDQDMYKAGLTILGQIQQLQATLNALYFDMTAVHDVVLENKWANDAAFTQKTEELLRSIVHVQDSVFTAYNAGYELSMRCR